MVSKDTVISAKILIVDDQDIHVHILEKTLIDAGYTNIYKTIDPRKVVGIYKNLRPDLLILDLNMPYINGLEIMSQIKNIEKTSYIPVIILSGDESKESRLNAFDAGAKDFINKPIDNVEVLIRIRNFLEVRLLHNQINDQNKNLEDKVKARTKELYESKNGRYTKTISCR